MRWQGTDTGTGAGAGTNTGAGQRMGGAADDEDRCRIAGDLIESGLPEVHPMLTAGRRETLEAALQGALTADEASIARRRRRALIPGIAVALAALVGVGVGTVWMRARPLGFQIQGGAVGAGGWVETGARQRAQVRFSDGTVIAMAEASAGRVTSRTADGATFTVDRGHARFDVIHRARARWLVEAGPFEIAVTGTRFDVDWSAERRHGLTIDLHAGSVVVRGALAGTGVPLRAGQRLLADLDRGTLMVVDASAAAGTRAGAGGAQPERPPAGRQNGQQLDGQLQDGQPQDDRREDRQDDTRGAGAVAPVSPRDGPQPSASARGEKGRPAHAPGAAVEPNEAAELTLPPARSSVLPLRSAPPAAGEREPAPWPVPSLPADSKLAAGGAACLGWAPQVRFDSSIDGASAASTFSLAFTHPMLDRGRSWCGSGSLRVDARFDLSGVANRLGNRPHHAGEALVELPAPVDLTGKTVTVHFFVEGPTDIRFGAQLFAVNRPSPDDAKWVGGGFTPDLTTGRWWTLTHTFERDNRLFEGGTSPVDRVEKVTLQIYAIGKDRVWTGRVFLDDLGWQ